jgi:hypothetical protein
VQEGYVDSGNQGVHWPKDGVLQPVPPLPPEPDLSGGLRWPQDTAHVDPHARSAA